VRGSPELVAFGRRLRFAASPSGSPLLVHLMSERARVLDTAKLTPPRDHRGVGILVRVDATAFPHLAPKPSTATPPARSASSPALRRIRVPQPLACSCAACSGKGGPGRRCPEPRATAPPTRQHRALLPRQCAPLQRCAPRQRSAPTTQHLHTPPAPARRHAHARRRLQSPVSARATRPLARAAPAPSLRPPLGAARLEPHPRARAAAAAWSRAARRTPRICAAPASIHAGPPPCACAPRAGLAPVRRLPPVRPCAEPVEEKKEWPGRR
jgi:hypothetical protein